MLGTLVEIGAAGERAAPAVEAAFASVEHLHRLMSFHEPGSDVSRINRAPPGEAIRIHSHTHRVLRFAGRMSNACGGVFDVTIADVLVRHGFLPAVPAEEARSREVTWADLELLADDHVRWRQAGRIDLGGVAKGYAVDVAIEVLKTHGVSSGRVNAGGDLRVFGEPQKIHVRLPDSPGSLAPLGSFSDCALATSAAYLSSRDSVSGPLEPLVDHQRRICAARQNSATVIAKECMTADALTKVVRLAPRIAPQVLDEFDAQAIIIQGMRQRTLGRTRYDGGYVS